MFASIITSAVAAKADDMQLQIVGLPFGADRQGQIFDANTNIDLQLGDAINVYHYHGFAEVASKSVGRIGTAIYRGIGTLSGITGHLFDVALDAGKTIARKIYADAKAGRARASSDSSGHLVRPAGIVGKPGRVTNWPIFAMSLMDAETADAAVNPRAIALAAAKSFTSNELELISGEADATKAGATFARRNRDRITAIKAMLDELMSEFPTEPTGETPAAKSIEVIQMSDINVEQLAADAAIEAVPVEVETPAAPAVEPTPAVKTFTQAEVESMVKDAAKAAAKSIAARRPAFGAPAIVRARGEAKPLSWAVKAALRTNGSILLRDTEDGLTFGVGEEGDGESAVKAFIEMAQNARVDIEGNRIFAVKAMATTTGNATGEHFIERTNSRGVVEALYQEVISRNLPGVDVFPMPSLICDAPTMSTFTAGWSAENADATSAGDATTGRKTLTAKNLTAWGELSNQLLSDSNPNIESYVRGGIASAMGEYHDIGAFTGDGTGSNPVGLLSESGPTSTVATTSVFEDVQDALGRMAVNKLRLNNICVIMHPLAVIKANKTKVSGTDYVVSGQAMTNPSFGGTALTQRLSERLGLPVFITTAIPVSGGASTIMVLRAPDWTIGDRQGIEIASSNVAGNSFRKNQTYIRAIMRVDFNLKRAASLEKITGFAH